MPYAFNGRVRIYWEEEGAGDPLLLITGLGFTLAMWGELREVMARHFHTILMDNRCAGKTDSVRRAFSMRAMADDAACVLDAAGVAAAHIAGMSMGGMIAQELALSHPDLVRKLILGCTWCGGIHAALPDVAVIGVMLSPVLSRECKLRAMVPFLYGPSTPRDKIERDLSIIRAHAPSHLGYVKQLGAILGWHAYRRLPDISHPTLVIHGDADRLVPPENGRTLAARIPGAKLQVLHGAGHIFPTDSPSETHRAMLTFLGARAAERIG